jgi:hypothetical protein
MNPMDWSNDSRGATAHKKSLLMIAYATKRSWLQDCSKDMRTWSEFFYKAAVHYADFFELAIPVNATPTLDFISSTIPATSKSHI